MELVGVCRPYGSLNERCSILLDLKNGSLDYTGNLFIYDILIVSF